ncbi:hypothetical protein [Haliangium sp.]|uniref:hypothetical protein n=1 Tax=Haliangium sp. TaxID=2663208 RepID=UPI003D0E0782
MNQATFTASTKASRAQNLSHCGLRNLLISIFAISAFAGCLSSGEERWDIDSSQHEALNFNALNFNALNFNALSSGTLGEDTVLLNEQSAGNLAETEMGRQLLRYIAGCALPEGDYLRVTAGDEIWDYPGRLAVAPSWVNQPLDDSQRQAMSACLMAHVNFYEVPVQISLRSDLLPSAEAEESARFFYGDGAFYGDLTGDSPRKYACKIRSNDFEDPTTGELTPANSPDAKLRICAGEDTAADCGFEFTGYCDEVCGSITADGDQWRFSACSGSDGKVYSEVFSVYLEGESAESCDTAPAGFTCDPR